MAPLQRKTRATYVYHMKVSCRSNTFNPFVNPFKSLINASYSRYNGFSISESLDQQSVEVQNKTDLSYPFLFEMTFAWKERWVLQRGAQKRETEWERWCSAFQRTHPTGWVVSRFDSSGIVTDKHCQVTHLSAQERRPFQSTNLRCCHISEDQKP